jgi:hypothetical protein
MNGTKLLSSSVVLIINKYGTVQYGTVQYGTVQYGTVQYGTVQYGTVQYGKPIVKVNLL